MKKIFLVVFILVVLCLIFYLYIQNKVNNEEVSIIPNSLETREGEEKITEKLNKKVEEYNEAIINNNKENMNAIFYTNKGEFTVELFKEQAPKTVENFIKLTKGGFYNDTKFHRIIAGFMNQGGDPFSKDDALASKWGTGGPGYQFEDEISALNKNDIGTISMANSGPNTNGSQFFINVAQNNFLDTKHTVFGKVISGMDVVMEINKVSTDSNDRPLSPIIIKNILIK